MTNNRFPNLFQIVPPGSYTAVTVRKSDRSAAELEKAEGLRLEYMEIASAIETELDALDQEISDPNITEKCRIQLQRRKLTLLKQRATNTRQLQAAERIIEKNR